MSLRWVVFAVVVGLPWAGPVRAGDDRVRVSVVVILANERDDTVDPRLECVAREVKKRHPKLTGFRLARTACKSLAVGRGETFELVGDQVVAVVVQQAPGRDERVRLKITPPAMGEITYSTACGKYLPILTTHRTKADELLILAVCVQPCDGKCVLPAGGRLPVASGPTGPYESLPASAGASPPTSVSP